MATRNDRPDPDPTRVPGAPPPPASAMTGATTTAGATTDTTVTGASMAPPQGEVRRRPRIRSTVSRVRPIVLKVRRRRLRGGKKRYSRNSKDAQRLVYGGSRALFRIADGFAAGADSFRRRSDRSARRRRDGLAKDFFRNYARGVDRASRQWGRAPYEIAREINGRRAWKSVRQFLRNGPFRLGYIR